MIDEAMKRKYDTLKESQLKHANEQQVLTVEDSPTGQRSTVLASNI